MALADALESGSRDALHDKLIDAQTKKESQVRQIQLGWVDSTCIHNHGCVLCLQNTGTVKAVLIEQLFSRGIMTMGPSRMDPSRQVGFFNSHFVASLPALQVSEMEKFRWLAGEWNYENEVPPTRVSAAYTDIGSARFSLCERNSWICTAAPDGQETRHITFDPFSRQWIYVLTQGSYGILRSSQGWIGEHIVFSGLMTMIGVNCEWRMTWTRTGNDEFGFINEERNEDGSWEYIDEWRFKRNL